MTSKGQKILIVDDKQENLFALRKVLKDTGAEIIEAASGNDALRAVLHHDFSLAILDVQMPDMDGYELAELIRSEGRLAHIPTIFLSGVYTDEAHVFRGYEAGAVDFIVKPYNPAHLLCKVRVFLQMDREKIASIRTSEERLRGFMNSATDGFALFDPDLRLCEINDSFLKLFPGEATRQNLLGRTAQDLQPVFEEHGDKETLQRILETGEPRFVDDLVIPGGPGDRHIVLKIFRVGLGLGVIGTDITERKQAEEEKASLEEQLRVSQKLEAVGQLAGGIAHDFNNLLTVITGYSQLLLSNMSPGDPSRNEIDQIQKAGERAASLTRQLLAFSRKQMLTPKVLDLNTLVTNTEKLLRRVIGEDISLVTALAPALGSVKADPGQIEQVIMNLALNARDAMPQGGRLIIETKPVELDAAYAYAHDPVLPGSYVLLAASDNGCGMDKETQARIFEPFFTTKDTGKGTGLGLSTVYGIVKQSGGYIWVYSEPGIGTSFKIYLPRVTEVQEDTPSAPGPAAAPGGSEAILLVED